MKMSQLDTSQLYHYTESGLSNIWLIDGFQHHETAFGPGVSIHDIDALHQSIAMVLVDDIPQLSGDEFRFIRKEMELSQRELAELIGVTEQTVANWEKEIPARYADQLIRAFYKDYATGEAQPYKLARKLARRQRQEITNLTFTESAEGWRVMAEAV